MHDLRHVENAAQFFGGRRYAHREQSITRFGGRNQMTDRADTANPRHERRHFRERTPLTELFKTTKLGNVKLRVRDFSLIVEMQGDLGVALDAGHGVDDDSPFL